MLVLLSALALAGYGDARNGRPNLAERQVHLWTNAVRVDPSAFQEAYTERSNGPSCWEDFTRSERMPKSPLAGHSGLYEAARVHSVDMQRTEAKTQGAPGSALSHDSSDGTTADVRIARYFTGYAYGENVAWGYPDAWDVVRGWMCSPQHRSNIMEAEFTAFGAGEAQPYWTQDFGAGPTPRVLNIGAHELNSSGDRVTFYVDVAEAADRVSVLIDGRPFDLRPWVGADDAGVRRLTVEVRDEGCHVYWFEAEQAGVVSTWPEDGAFGFGACTYDQEGAGWFANRDEATAGVDEPLEGGCSTVPSRWGFGLLGLLALRRRSARA